MHEKSPILNVARREKVGTRYNNRLREKGSLPAVVYGRGRDPVSISLNHRDFTRLVTKGEKIFRLDVPASADLEAQQMVLLRDLQFDYLGTNIVHADFTRVSLTDRVRTRVPVHLVGEAKGLKQAGAILMHPVSELEVECVVTELPDYLEVNIADLDVGHAISVGEVKSPVASMKILTDPHALVAQIVIQQEIVVAEAAAAPTGDAAQPEVLTAKKPEDAAKPGAAPAKPGAAPAKDAKSAPKK
ncbi:MAG: 50S ribosomal protein L25 [Phycisphaeraceae bacterium]|nr:50S ribosomal protein L25 [Phycisphaerae bacterium]MBX3393543.1 50S ribosomal protein L25 [Phycisphaeraceae bacterium]